MKNIKRVSPIKLYFHYISVHIKSVMQFKASLIMSAIGQFLISFNVFLGVYFMFKRFSNIKGFTYSEVLLCFSVMLLSFSFAEAIARGFDTFPNTVRRGGFDRIMVRPRNEILQVLGSSFELSRIGRTVQAIVMFAYGISHCDVEWSVPRILTAVFMIVGGTSLFCGIFLLYAALCFYTLDGLEFVNILTDGAKEYGKYPVNAYGKRMMQLCTFVVPYAVVQYYPLLFLTGRTNSWFYVFIPLTANLFLIPCFILWKIGVKHYKSTGS